MLPELRYELLFFYTRDELERLQPLSRSLLKMIVAGSNVLPLRPIGRIDMGWMLHRPDDKIKIFIKPTPIGGAPKPDYEASTDVGDFAETFRRLQNACIMDFNFDIRDMPFMRYWKGQGSAVFIVVSIDFCLTDDTDYGVVDSFVNYLRPRTTAAVHIEESLWQENGNSDIDRKYLDLLVRESFLTNLQTCRLTVWDEAFPPPSFILEEPGYANYELGCACWCDGCQVSDGIDAFIESFVHDGCANEKLETVCIKWTDPQGQQSPALKQLKEPTKIDLPLPENDLTEFLTNVVHRVTQCEMHSLVNAKQCKRMELHKWTVEYDEGRRRWTSHFLQCRVQNF